MLNRYLKALESKISHYHMTEVEKQEILDQYSEKIESLKADKKTDLEILETLPTPKMITEEMNILFEKKRRVPFTDRILSASPFLVLLGFLYLGIFYNMWHPGWLLILFIPGLAAAFEILNDPNKNIVQAILPFLLLIAFYIFGLGYGQWMTAWSLLLIVPVIALFDSQRLKQNPRFTLMMIVPFISLFIILNLMTLLDSHPAVWVIILINPVIWFTYIQNGLKRYLLIFTTLLITGFYLYLGFELSKWGNGLFLFLILVPLLRDHPQLSTVRSNIFVVIWVVILSFVLFGYLGYLGYFNVSWLFFLLIPLTLQVLRQSSIIKKILATCPYFVLSAFFILGNVYDAFHPGWILLLLIPIQFILKGFSRNES